MPGDFLVDYIKREEGFVSHVYDDAVGYQTIGYGHLILPHEVEKFRGKKLSEAEAEILLRQDIKEHQRETFKDLKVSITEEQRAAITSFAFNVGAGNARKIVGLVNEGKLQQAADKMLLYNTAKDKRTRKRRVIDSLTQRRQRERALFLGIDPPKKSSSGVSRQVSTTVSTDLAAAARYDVAALLRTQDQSRLSNANAEVLSGLRQLTAQLSIDNEAFALSERFLERIRREGSGR